MKLKLTKIEPNLYRVDQEPEPGDAKITLISAEIRMLDLGAIRKTIRVPNRIKYGLR